MKHLPALASCAVLMALSSCGKGDKNSDSNASSGDSSSSKSAGAGGNSSAAAATKEKEVPDVPPKGPATPTEAARTLDLRTLPLMQDLAPKSEPQRTIANFSCRVKGKVKDIYEFYQKELAGHRWKIDPNAYVSDDSASATFSRNTFHVSLTVSPISEPGIVEVSIHNHGNVDLSKLPRPPVIKTTYEGPITSMYVADGSVADTARACQDLLVKGGWQPYGSAGDTNYFKQNGIHLTVTVSAAPAEGGKTMISYFGEQMSADIPLLADAQDVRYDDSRRRLSFISSASMQDVAAQYQQLLAKDGWKSTTDKLIVNDDKKGFLVFRETGDGMLDLNVKGRANSTYVDMAYSTYTEYKEMEKKWKEQEAAKKAQDAKAGEAAGQPK